MTNKFACTGTALTFSQTGEPLITINSIEEFDYGNKQIRFKGPDSFNDHIVFQYTDSNLSAPVVTSFSALVTWIQSTACYDVLTTGATPIITVSTQVGATYQAAIGDAQTLVEMELGTAQSFEIPLDATVDFPIGSSIDVVMQGIGVVTIDGEVGVTLNSRGGLLDINGQFGVVSVTKTAADEWLVEGDLA